MADISITTEDIPSTNPAKAVKMLHFTGQLDESNVDEKSKEVYQLIEAAQGPLYLIFDLAGLEYMNSKSIGYLTDWYTKLSEKQGGIVLAQARPNILDILQVVGITQLIQSYATIEEAKAAVIQ